MAVVVGALGAQLGGDVVQGVVLRQVQVGQVFYYTKRLATASREISTAKAQAHLRGYWVNA